MMKKPEGLSDEGWYLGRSMLSMMVPGGELTFRMQKNRPTKRTQAALDDLVKAGLVSEEPFNKLGGKVYRPLIQFPRATQKDHKAMGSWPIVEEIK